MKRYLVTGGAGFIGSSITKRLLNLGHFVRVIDNGSRGSKDSLGKSTNLEFIQADIRDSKSVIDACKNIDSIIHLAFVNGTKYFYEKPDVVLDVGIRGMLSVLQGAEKYQTKELFLASSSEVYQTPSIIPTPENVPLIIPDPLNPRYSYAGGKIISELMSLYMGQKIFEKVVIFRPHNVYGPHMGYEHVIPELIQKILKTPKIDKKITIPIQSNGKTSRAFIYIDDFVDGIILLLNKSQDREIYNIGTEQEISIKDLVTNLANISKLEISLKNDKATAKGGTMRRCPDITKIKKLGFAPKISLIEGLKKTYQWYYNDYEKNA